MGTSCGWTQKLVFPLQFSSNSRGTSFVFQASWTRRCKKHHTLQTYYHLHKQKDTSDLAETVPRCRWFEAIVLLSDLPKSSLHEVFNIFVFAVLPWAKLIWLIRLIERTVSGWSELFYFNTFEFLFNRYFFLILSRAGDFLVFLDC